MKPKINFKKLLIKYSSWSSVHWEDSDLLLSFRDTIFLASGALACKEAGLRTVLWTSLLSPWGVGSQQQEQSDMIDRVKLQKMMVEIIIYFLLSYSPGWPQTLGFKWSSCLSLSAGTTGMHHHALPVSIVLISDIGLRDWNQGYPSKVRRRKNLTVSPLL